MGTCIAFFRGINTGGRNRLPMKDLVELFERIGIHRAGTYSQSGNVAFRCTRQQRPEVARRIAASIRQEHGFEPRIHVITIQELEHAVAANPFMDARKDASNLHLWFLRDAPASSGIEALDRLKSRTERFAIDRKVFYLHAPDGLESSQVAAALEQCLGTDGPVRDWQTVTKTLELGWDLV